jgi:protein O-mannosyl-transferase
MVREKIIRSQAIHIFLIVFLCTLVYSNTLHVPFLFDDIPNIVDNPMIKTSEAIIQPSKFCSGKSMLPEQKYFCDLLRMRYIGYLTFAFNYKVHNLNEFGYHVINLLIHILNGILVYFLVMQTLRTPVMKKSEITHAGLIPLFSALLFVLHPIQTQAVTYIVQRFTSLATSFYLLSLLIYIIWRLSDKKLSRNLTIYILSIISAVLAMKTKEIAFTLPVIIILYEFLFFEGNKKIRIASLVPFILTMFIIPVGALGLLAQQNGLINDINESTKVMTVMSRWDYLYTQLRVIITYLRLIIFPVNQNLDYNYPLYTSFFDGEVLSSFLALLVLFMCAIYLLYRSKQGNYVLRLISFGILWFFITISVESSFIPIADVIFEHRVYLPSVGLFVAIVVSIVSFVDGYVSGKSATFFLAALIFLISISFAGASFARNRVWRDEITMWSDVVMKSPMKARVHNNLGFAFEKRGLYNKALEHLTRAIALNLLFDEAYYNRGNVYYKIGQYDLAIYDYTQTIMINPLHVNAYNNRGILVSLKGNFDEAINDFNMALMINPYFANAYCNRGLTYLDKGIIDISDFQEACNLGDSKGCELAKKYRNK